MPTVLQQSGISVMIYTNDHEPPHVHCWKGRAELVLNLAPVSIRENIGMKKGDARRAVEIVEANTPQLLTEWRRIHP